MIKSRVFKLYNMYVQLRESLRPDERVRQITVFLKCTDYLIQITTHYTYRHSDSCVQYMIQSYFSDSHHLSTDEILRNPHTFFHFPLSHVFPVWFPISPITHYWLQFFTYFHMEWTIKHVKLRSLEQNKVEIQTTNHKFGNFIS